MNSKRLLLTTIASALLLSGAIAGCGSGDDDSSKSTETAPPALESGSTGSGGNDTGKEDAGKQGTGNGPASANDEKKDAPDDAISERPGGPDVAPPPNPSPSK